MDLAAQHAALEEPLKAALERVLRSQRFILGPEVKSLEEALGAQLGAEHAIAVSSGTDALLVSLLAAGIGPGDEVITTPFTFIATAEVIARVGATPRFVDIARPGFHLDPSRVRDAITERTRAILSVHLFGMPAAPAEILEVADAAQVLLIEDAAQALGAKCRGRALGTWGALGSFSFFPSKPLGALGDGGMIVTSDPDLGATCRMLRVHGATEKHHQHTRVGGNFRLDALQAAVLRVKLPHLLKWQAARAERAAAYAAGLADLPGLVLPACPADCESAWSHYTVRILGGRRDALASFLALRHVASAVYYPRPLHLQRCFAHLGLGPGAFPEAERACREVLSLPLYAELRPEQQGHVIAAVREFFAAG